MHEENTPAVSAEIFPLLMALNKRAIDLRTRSEFWPAVRGLASDSLTLLRSARPPLRHIDKDSGGVVLCQALFCACSGEVFETSIAEIRRRVVRVRAASRGRVDVLIDYMLHHGLIQRVGTETPLRLTPSPELDTYYREVIGIGLAALSVITPGTGPREVDAGMALAVWRSSERVGEGLMLHAGDLSPVMTLMGQRNGGMRLVYGILALIPGVRPLAEARISVSALSKACEVSRPHVLKLLADIHRDGLVIWDPVRRTVQLTEHGLAEFESFFSGLLAICEMHLNEALGSSLYARATDAYEPSVGARLLQLSG